MRRYWRDLWGTRAVTVRSSLSPAAAVDRLAAARGRAFAWPPGSSPTPRLRIVTGRLSVHRVWLRAHRPGSRNSWRPTLRGRFEPAPGGSVLVGAFTVHPVSQAFTALWLIGLGSCAVIGLAAAVAGAVRRDPSVLLGALGLAGAALGMAAFGVTLTIVGNRFGIRDERALRWWLDRHLHVGV